MKKNAFVFSDADLTNASVNRQLVGSSLICIYRKHQFDQKINKTFHFMARFKKNN